MVFKTSAYSVVTVTLHPLCASALYIDGTGTSQSGLVLACLPLLLKRRGGEDVVPKTIVVV